MSVTLKKDMYEFTICNLYAPNEDNPNFFVKMLSMFENSSENKILIGDFNLVLDETVDSLNTTNNNRKSLLVLQEIISEALFVDVWRIRNGDTKGYSYLRRKPVLRARRLDFALVNVGMEAAVSECFYTPEVLTDHSAFYLVLRKSSQERGRGYWKFNTSHLRQIDFIEQMNQVVSKRSVYHLLKKSLVK